MFPILVTNVLQDIIRLGPFIDTLALNNTTRSSLKRKISVFFVAQLSRIVMAIREKSFTVISTASRKAAISAVKIVSLIIASVLARLNCRRERVIKVYLLAQIYFSFFFRELAFNIRQIRISTNTCSKSATRSI